MDEKKLPITVVIPVKNEGRNLPQCLSKLRRFVKIIVVDSGSTDNTKDIAESFGCEFVTFNWNGHFPKKNPMHLSSRMKYILSIVGPGLVVMLADTDAGRSE